MFLLNKNPQRVGFGLAGVSRQVACALLVALGMATMPSLAAEPPSTSAKAQAPIVITLKQFKVLKDANGEPKYIDASLVVPGDIIEYRATYTNRGAVPLSVTATLPVPESVEYMKDSAKSKSNLPHTVALKDQQFAAEPLMKRTATPSGATLLQPVPYAAYRFVRWDLSGMAPGTSVEVSIKAMVSNNLDADAAPK